MQKQALDKRQEIRCLSDQRSRVLNIGLTKLPPPRAIKQVDYSKEPFSSKSQAISQAILKFDSSILNKDGLEKIIREMLPSEEEKERIAEAEAANPDMPLGQAEQFLQLLGSIPDLLPRLKLWLFMMDYANIEKVEHVVEVVNHALNV